MPSQAGSPSVRTLLGRVLRAACPACGKGAIYRRNFRRSELCSHCGWRFERGQGHWIGGSEVHMFGSYGLSVVLFVPFLVLFGASPLAQALAVLGHVVLSLAIYRYSRAVFLAFDYKIDPSRDDGGDSGGDDDGPHHPAWPRWPPTEGRRYVRVRRSARQRV
jgi:uncharacterized protein (DUF983 family)